MNVHNLLRLSWIELLRAKKTTVFLILNFTLGLVGFFLLQVFQQSLSQQTEAKAQTILGGDISVSARRGFTEAEIAAWEKNFSFEKKTQVHTLFSMLRNRSDSRLVSVLVFDSQYPLYGEFKIDGIGFTADRPRVWVDSEVKEFLNLEKGQPLALGDGQFEFSGVVTEDPTRLFRGTGFAPRVFIHKNFLKYAQLIKPGSTFSEQWIYRLNSSDAAIASASGDNAIKTHLEKEIKDSAVQIESAKDNAQDSNRVLKYFSDYLGLVALVALGLCLLCGSYLLQWIFQNKRKDIAIYKTLGLSDLKILFLYFIQNLIVSVLSCALSLAVVTLLIPLVQNFLIQRFSLPIQLAMDAQSILILSFIGILGPIMMAVPTLLQIFEMQALSLFQNQQVEIEKASKGRQIWVSLAVFLFWALSVWQSHSWSVGTGFTAMLIGLVFAFGFLNRWILHGIERISVGWHWLLRYSLMGLTRRYHSTRLVFITMSLATLVLSLLPHIKSSILNEIRPATTSQIPQLFLFDIQPEQVAPLQEVSQRVFQAPLELRPLVRSRILKVNEQDYERQVLSDGFETRESENEARFRNRGVNLTYAKELNASETVVKGQFQSEAREGELPKISLEEKYAERVKVRVGDTMTFDVQGLEMKAVVSSLRQVRWTSFQPNFFILFPLGVLEDAPKIFLTSVPRSLATQASVFKSFQFEVAQKFKNISIVDVSRTIENALVYINQMSTGLQFMAWLAVLVGFFVFTILLNTQLRERLHEMNLIQMLGAEVAQIQLSLFIQFFTLVVVSLTTGIVFGMLVAEIVMRWFFRIESVFDFLQLGYVVVLILPLAAVVILIGLRPLRKLNPIELIRQL